MKILLTGATGFFGFRLLEALLGRGHQVIVAKRIGTDVDRLFKHFGVLETWNIDETDAIDIFVNHPDVEVIIHAATDYGRDESRPVSAFWSNVTFPMRLLDLAVGARIPLFINIDTFFNMGSPAYEYLGAYTLSKRHFQEWGCHCANGRHINFINLRLFHLYGPGDGLEKFVPAMVQRCLAGQQIDLSDGEQKRDFIHVDDAVLATCTVLEAAPGKIHGYRHFDVGTGTSVRIRDFVETIQRICATGAKLNFGALPTRAGEFKDARADTTALCQLGWSPKIGIEAGIRSVIEYLGLD